jgi:branched-chain amino acid transport system permease protein
MARMGGGMAMARARRAMLADGGPALALLVIAALLPAVASSEYVLLAASMIVTALVGVSFNLLFGYTGMFSFGQAAFYGLGAYATALAMNEASLDYFLALVAGVLVAVAVAAASGAVLVRMAPVAFVMLTFALGALLQFVAAHSPRLTGGDDGLIATSLPHGLNVVLDVNGTYYAMLAVAAATLAGVFAFVRSRAGLLLRGIREDALRARTLGVAVERRKLGVFALAAGVAAIGGGLSVLSTQIVYPDVFDWKVSANALIVTLLGGVGRFSGPLVGAVALGLIDFYVGKLSTDTLLVEGMVLLAVILLAPRGIVSLGHRHGVRAGNPQAAGR